MTERFLTKKDIAAMFGQSPAWPLLFLEGEQVREKKWPASRL